ncbi:hypothetical protein B0H14DRAFT_3056906, partial [Mycena olivaceomarginata]
MRPSEGLLGVSIHICVVSCLTLLFICYPCFISCFPAYLLCLLTSPRLLIVCCLLNPMDISRMKSIHKL